MNTLAMTPLERRSSIALASIMTLRLLGLFLILPLFILYANQLPGANASLAGLALGIYGLTQAILQAPFGILSDHFGRKSVISLGLVIFILGSLICASAHTITTLIAGRALQGCGAVGSVILALAADLTRPNQRTKTMAIMGISIGFSFLFAMLLGPILNTQFSVPQIFILCALLGIIAIVILYSAVPTALLQNAKLGTSTTSSKQLSKILMNSKLLYLDVSILLLQALLTINFIIIPINLLHRFNMAANQQWRIYLPTLVLSVLFMLPGLQHSEQTNFTAKLLKITIACLCLAEVGLWSTQIYLIGTAISLLVFFTAFNFLEAHLPALVSKLAPQSHRGAAIGLFSSCQFLGIFIGGSLGGWLYQHYHTQGLFGFSLLSCFCWLLATLYITQHNNFLANNTEL